MLNLDPALLDQNKVRLKRRKHLFKVYAAPIILLLAAAIFFGRMGIYNIFLSIEAESRTFSVSSVMNNIQISTNLVEPYVAYFNDGYMKMVNAKNDQDLDEAIKSFKESLVLNPPEEISNAIYKNISYALELKSGQGTKKNVIENDSVGEDSQKLVNEKGLYNLRVNQLNN